MPDESDETTTGDEASAVLSVSEMAPGLSIPATNTTTAAAASDSPDWKSQLEAQRAINRKLEADNKRNAAAVKRLAELEDRDKTELERATARAEAAEKRAADIEEATRARLAESSIIDAAVKANANSPALVWMAAQQAGVDYDGSGRVKDPARLVASILKEYPALAGRKAASEARDVGKSAGGTDMNALIRRQAGVQSHQP